MPARDVTTSDQEDDDHQGSAGDVLFAGALTLFALAVMGRSLSYGLATDGQVGSGAVPFLAASILFVVCLSIFVAAWRARTQATSKKPLRALAPRHRLADAALRRSLRLFVGLVGAVLLSYVAGLLAAGVLFVVFVGIGVERLSLWRVAILAGIAVVMLWVIFGVVLDVPMTDRMTLGAARTHLAIARL